MRDIVKNKKLKPFDTLLKEYTLSHHEAYTYTRISHLLASTNIPTTVSIPTPTFQYLFTSPCPKRGISQAYACLNNTKDFSQLHTLDKWTKELDTPISQDQWLRAFRETHKASHCSNHWESYQKTIHRWYLTPYRLSKMYQGHPPSCWRKCGSTGTIAHVLWFCKSLSSFWNQIFTLLSTITGIHSSPTPEAALLHIGIEKYPVHCRSVVIHLLHAAKLNITRLWKTCESPSISNTITDLNIQCEMEKIVARNNLQLEKFREMWSPWLNHPKCNVQP